MSNPDLIRLIGANYPALADSLLAPLIDLLSRARQSCGGDAEKFLIVLVIAIRTTGHADFATFTSEQLASGEPAVFPNLGINVRSIAESIDAPRETVRRKVGELERDGWIVRQDGGLHLTGLALQGLTSPRQGLHAMVAAHYEIVDKLIATRPAARLSVEALGPLA